MFRVEWLQLALDDLASVWVQADSTLRQTISTATNLIDSRLRTAPDQQGESRADGERILFIPPLGISFEVDSQQHLVNILHVWAFRQRGR
jgi:hypothetical protein